MFNESARMNKTVSVLHLFYQYLNETENWVFRLVQNLPDTQVLIGSKHFLRKNFYDNRFGYIEFPVKPVETRKTGPSKRCFNRAVKHLLNLLYPRFIMRSGYDIDVMHSHFSFVGWDYLKLARKMGVPHVVSFYGVDYESLPYNEPVWGKRYPILFKEANLFLCEGTHGAALLARMGCPPEKIRVARLGVDSGKICFSGREKKSGELRLLQIARMEEKKGHIYTVKAFTKALQDCPNMTLTIVGSASEDIKTKIDSHIQAAGVGDKITFIDRIDFARLYDFMGDFQGFIHPSCYATDRNCEGGAPVVLLDAQATGMPVISTTHCDIPDVVVHGRTGLLTPEKDAESLAQSIRHFYRMENAEYQSFARAARQHVEDNYDAKKNAATVATLYRELLRRG